MKYILAFIKKVDFITNQNKLLAGHPIKNKIRQLLSKHEDGNDIHEHRKEQNE